jgi:hypothetical protein
MGDCFVAPRRHSQRHVGVVYNKMVMENVPRNEEQPLGRQEACIYIHWVVF